MTNPASVYLWDSRCATAAAEAALSDQEVVARVLAGETASYGILVRRHHLRMYRLVRSILGSHEDVEDVMQEAHFRAMKYLDRFEGRSSFLTWLSRVMINEAYTHLRRTRRHQPLDDPVVETQERRRKEFASPAANPEQQIIGQEFQEILKEAVDSLPEPYRAVFENRAIEQISVSETAARLGVTQQCVKSRALRARRLLQHRVARLAPASFETRLSIELKS